LDAFMLFSLVLAVCYAFVKRTYSYWERNGFKTSPNVSYLFGHLKSAVLQKESAGDCLKRLYESTNEPFIGMYSILRPVLLVRDPELVPSILIKDFAYFNDRGTHCEKYDALSSHLFALPEQRWKNLRTKLTPAFTSGKLKAMFPMIYNSASTLQSSLENLTNEGKLLDVREMAACFTTNVISSVAFGIETDSITNPKNEFRECGRKIFESTIWNAIRMFLNFLAPQIMSVFRIKFADPHVENFLRSIVKQNIEHREKDHVVRKDFFQLLIQLRNTGTVQLDDEWETVIKGDESQKSLSEDEIAAQTFVFFAAGFETSSTSLAFCMYELAKNQEIQERVHNEIDQVLNKHNGVISYESIMDMKYLNACLDEILRLYPTLSILNRRCIKKYNIPGKTDKVIEKGTQVFISATGMQRDPKYYENPDTFDPNRFFEGNADEKNFVSRPYLPFGIGPRNCIGMRLGKMQTKVGLVMMLKGFRFELDDKNYKIQFDPKSFVISPLKKIQLLTFRR